jgi:hypothetical protein
LFARLRAASFFTLGPALFLIRIAARFSLLEGCYRQQVQRRTMPVPDQSTSLIQRDEQQLSLMHVDEAILRSEEEAGTYTGERYYQQHPHAYRAIVALLADGAIGMHRIAAMVRSAGTKCSVNTVAAIRDREPDLIERAQKQLSQVAFRGARMAVEAIVDKLSNDEVLEAASLQQLGVITGILTDKGQLLSGGPTSRVEVADRRATREDYEAFVAQLQAAQAQPCIEAEASEPAMGFNGGNRGAKGGGSAVGLADGDDPEQPGDEADIGVENEDIDPLHD